MGPNTGDKQQQAQVLADELLGSSEPLPEYVIEDTDLCQHLDELALMCECCSWWVEPHELDEEGDCEDCQ
jgi:hypothetical protein